MTNSILNPSQRHLLRSIERADLAQSTKAKYSAAVAGALANGIDFLDADSLAGYARTLPAGTRNILRSAIRTWLTAATTDLKNQADALEHPAQVLQMQAALWKFEALQDAVHYSRRSGKKAHTWLTADQVEQLYATCDDSIRGRRDHVVLALLCATGVRREEASNLEFNALRRQPVDSVLRDVIEVHGKGAKDRVIPISDKLAGLLRSWEDETGPGRICRSVRRGGKIGASLSPVGIFYIVREHGALIGVPELAPHDLRRTYTEIGLQNGIPITQIKVLLGHESVATTETYLELDLDLELTISDFVPV